MASELASRPTTPGDGARRRRPLLLILTTLGVVTGLLGLAGVFALGSDTASTGPNDARTGDLPLAVDLQLASASQGPDGSYACGTDWADDLTTGVILSDGLDLWHQSPEEPEEEESSEPSAPEMAMPRDTGALCVRNLGVNGTELRAFAFDVVDEELACSPEEESSSEQGDPDCGAGFGELSQHLETAFGARGPDGDCTQSDGEATIRNLTYEGGMRVGYLAAGDMMVLCPVVQWNQRPESQSDQVSWRYRFEGQQFDTVEGGTTCRLDDEYEPNDSQGAVHFTNNGFDEDATLSASSCAGNTDFYFVSSLSDDPMRFELEWLGQRTHLELYLYGPNGVELAAGTSDLPYQIIEIAPVGVYHMEVRHISGPSTDYYVNLRPLGG